MAKKKKADDAPPATPFANLKDVIEAEQSGTPIAGDVILVEPIREKDHVTDYLGRVLIGPVVVEGVRYENVRHQRSYTLTVNGKECHFVGDKDDAREYRPFV